MDRDPHGIRERRVQTSESLTELGAKAALAALENAGAEKESVDLVLCTTVRGDAVTPGQACLIERELGLRCRALTSTRPARVSCSPCT